MSNLPHQYSKSLEVLVMFEPHRLQHQFLRAAYASLVPVSRRCISATRQPIPVLWKREQGPLPAEKEGAHYE
jgi:hypothetical protein